MLKYIRYVRRNRRMAYCLRCNAYYKTISVYCVLCDEELVK